MENEQADKGGVDMQFRARTVALMVIVSIVLSSVTTAAVVKDGGILDRLAGTPALWLDGDLAAAVQGDDEGFEKLKTAYAVIKSQYVRGANDKKLIDGAIQGMVDSLGDPYSVYMDPSTAKQFESNLESSFQGIGAEVTMKNGKVTIVSPFKDSPAEKAGLRPNDQVIKVNGVSLEGMSLNEAVMKIRGPKGTIAKLEVIRPGYSGVLHINVKRDNIPIKTVESKMMPEQIGYIQITQFSNDTAKDFGNQLKQLESKGMKGLVIDVRGNPGGLLPSVLDIADQLVPGGKNVLITQDKAGNKVVYKSKLQGKKSYPISVMIDKGSASASEILAAALKESAGAQVVGEKSFGKGTVQTVKDFGDGSNLKLTVAKWLTPSGTWIDQHGGTGGIQPTLPVKSPEYEQATPPSPGQTLKRDMNSPAVRNLQMVLDGLGFNPGRKDGYFDQKTELAVKSFQKIKGLPMTGVVDDKTAAKIQDAFIAMLRDPANDVQLQVAIEAIKKKIR